MAEVTPKDDERSWAAGLEYITDYLVDQLVGETKAVTYNPNFDKDEVLKIARAALEKVVVPFADLREEELKKQLEATQDQLQSLISSKEAVDSEVENLRKELENAEESYNRQIRKMGDDHQASLTKVDEDIAAKINEITALKKQVSALRRDLSKKIADEDKEAYIQNLEDNYNKTEKENKELHAKLVEAEATINEQSQELRQERSDTNNFLNQLEARKKELDDVRRSHKELNQRIQNLQEQKAAADQAARDLRRSVEDKEKAIEDLEEEVGSLRKQRAGSSRSDKSGSNTPGILSGLEGEMEAAEKDERINELQGEIADLKKQAGKLKQDLAKSQNEVKVLEKKQKDAEQAKNKAEERVKTLEKEASRAAKSNKERDELQAQLKKVSAKNDENAKEIRRLRPYEGRVDALEKRERELQSQLKVRAQEIKRAEDKVKRVEEDAKIEIKARTDEINAKVTKCENERTELEKKIEEATRQLERERKEHDEALGRSPSDDELKELRRRLRQAEDDLREERAARVRLEETIKDLEAELEQKKITMDEEYKGLRVNFEEQLAKANSSRDELAEYFRELFGNLTEHSREVQADLEAHVKLSQATRDEYLKRIGRMNDNIKNDPDSAESGLAKRRVQGVEREVERMNGIIGALGSENEWFQDVIRRFDEGQQKVLQAAEEAAAEAATARERAEAARNAAVPPAAATPSSLRDRIFGERFLYLNLITFAVLFGVFIAHGREYGAIRAANQPAKRAIYMNSLDRGSLCLKLPTWEFLWEFLVFVGVGAWRWKA